MFDQIDAAYYRQLADEARGRADHVYGKKAERFLRRALRYEAKSSEFTKLAPTG